MEKFDVKILDIKDEYNLVKTYTLEKPQSLIWDEGSSFYLGLPGYDKDNKINKKLIHHLSINSLIDENYIKFSTKIPIKKSQFKKALSTLKLGDEVSVFDLKSNMKLIRENKPIVLLSMGIGITTMRPLIKKYINDPTDIPKLTSINVSEPDRHLFIEELVGIINPSFELIWIEDSKTYLEKVKEISKNKDNLYYVVGSESFVFDTIFTLIDEKVDKSNIMIDKDNNKREIVFNSLENYKIIK